MISGELEARTKKFRGREDRSLEEWDLEEKKYKVIGNVINRYEFNYTTLY